MNDSHVSTLTRTAPARARTAIRSDIQALRAVAILAVVLNHLWPAGLAGGYVGVDVFFVISGFLITSHLLREVEGSGRIALAAFYARRVRRFLPAALLVLAVSAVGPSCSSHTRAGRGPAPRSWPAPVTSRTGSSA